MENPQCIFMFRYLLCFHQDETPHGLRGFGSGSDVLCWGSTKNKCVCINFIFHNNYSINTYGSKVLGNAWVLEFKSEGLGCLFRLNIMDIVPSQLTQSWRTSTQQSAPLIGRKGSRFFRRSKIYSIVYCKVLVEFDHYGFIGKILLRNILDQKGVIKYGWESLK